MFWWILFPASAEVGCDAVWEKDLNSHICYQFNLLSSLSWSEAHSSCQMQGGALLSIADETEENVIRSKYGDIDIDTIKWFNHYIHACKGYVLKKKFLEKYFSFISTIQTYTQNFDLNPRPFSLALGIPYLLLLGEEQLRPPQGTQSLQLKQVPGTHNNLSFKVC